jgi:hypothetical protein
MSELSKDTEVKIGQIWKCDNKSYKNRSFIVREVFDITVRVQWLDNNKFEEFGQYIYMIADLVSGPITENISTEKLKSRLDLIEC